jgi:hypothetical protein
LSALVPFEPWCLDRTVLEGATNGALDSIERLWPDSYFAGLNLHDRPRIQSATRRQFVLANAACRSFSPDVCAQRLPQRLSRDPVWLR